MSSSGASITATFGSAPAAGDVLVAAVVYQGPNIAVNTPSGWSAVETVATGAIGQTTFYHVVGSGESASYSWTANSVAMMTVAVQDVSGADTSNPIAGHVATSAGVGYSMTTGTLNTSGALPLAFFAQFANGRLGQFYNGTSTWNGRYTVNASGGNALAQEALYGPFWTSSVNATESWQGGNNSDQVSELVLLNPSGSGSGGGGTVGGGGTGATHVHVFAYYGGDNENTNIPASFMAAHVDMVEVAQPGFANSFISAGGTYAMLYTDPFLIPYCPTPYPNNPGSCAGPAGNANPESAWLHDATSTRIHTGGGQDALNPFSSGAQYAYNQYTAQATSGNSINALMADDTNPTYLSSYWQYKFGADAIEVISQGNPQAYWLAGTQAMFAAAAKPVLYNGGDGDANDMALVTSPNVLGKIEEGCAVFGAWRVNDTQGNPANTWGPDMNKLLATTNAHRYAVCFSYSVVNGDTIGDRLYALASWWQTYDPTYSVAFPDFSTPDYISGSASKIFPEYDIVPTNPVQSAGSNIANLRTATGAYVREFAACYQSGTYIGHCAAIVNPSYASTVSVPSLSQSYSRVLVLNAHSEYNGGTATWGGSVPSSLPPETGVILLQ